MDRHHRAGAATAFDIAMLVAFWCLCVVVVNPVGNFPLADDWVYGLTLKHLIDTGEYSPYGGALILPTAITNILWGWLFCLPAGFGFTALHLSTLLAGLVGLVGTYILVLELPQCRWVALIAALTLAVNPIYCALSFTFDTDVLFTALSIWSIVFFARNLRRDSIVDLIAGTALALGATLSRQVGLCVPLAFAFTILLSSGIAIRTAVRAAIPTIVCAGGYFALRAWLSITGRAPEILDWDSYLAFQTLMHFGMLARTLLGNAFVLLVYLGLFIFPALLLFLVDIFRSQRSHLVFLISAGSLALFGGAMVRMGHAGWSPHNNPILMPMLGDMLHPWGVGWLMFVPGFAWNASPFLLGSWIVVTATGVFSAVLLIAHLGMYTIDSMRSPTHLRLSEDSQGVGAFLLLCGLIYLSPLLIVDRLYDRYIIPVVPIFLALLPRMSGTLTALPPASTRKLRYIALSLLSLSSFFSVGATRDYLTWNRLRWDALQSLMRKEHVAPTEIDGGIQFNGLYAYDPRRKAFYDYRHPEETAWVLGKPRDTYIVAFGLVPGYTIFRVYTYYHWLPPHPQQILVLHKTVSLP